MMFQFRSFTVKDLVFLAIMAGALVLSGMLTIPLILSLDVYGLPHLVTAPFYAFFCVIALMKVKKPGAMTIMGTLNGLVLLMMSPLMLLMQASGAALAELIALAVYKGYDNKKCVLLAAGLYIPLVLPLGIVFHLLIRGGTAAELLAMPGWAFALVAAGSVGLSAAGALLGRKAGRELQRAGKL